MKVLVADDEERVCALICALIDWEGLALEKVGTAYDGISALSLIEETKPDLVITDIRMPGLDGLELIRRAKAMQSQLQFIIISGHKQFDYAQSAIKYGVAEYLLKPIKQVELNQTLSRMRKQYDAQQNSHIAAQQLKDDQTYLKRTSFAGFLASGDTQLLNPWKSEESLQAIAVITIQGQCSSYVVGVLQEKIQQILEREDVDSTITAYEDELYILFFYSHEQKDSVITLCHIMMEMLKTQMQIFQDLLCSLALGLESNRLYQLKESLLAARQALHQRLIKGHQQCFFSKQVENVSITRYLNFVATTFEQYCAQEELHSQPMVVELLAMLDENRESLATTVETLLVSYEQAYEFVKQQGTEGMEGVPIASQLLRVATLADLKKKFEEALDLLLNVFLQGRDATLSKPIKIALSYLQYHFQDELLSLESVSEIVNLNSSYFSALFKKRMNQGFSDYILQLRIKKAKELLVETNLSIAQIAQQVGYHDPKHFSKLFKKQCQIKPNEYRKLYG